MSLSKSLCEYQPVRDEEDSDQIREKAKRPCFHRRHGFAVLSSIAAFTVFISIGFLLGYKYSQLQHKRYDLESSVPLERIIINQGPDRSYLQRPSPEADAVWAKLYPQDGHGVFLDAVDGDKIVGFAAFHELHCVNTLLKRHYQVEDIKEALISGSAMPSFDSEISHTHTLHCIEVLRQATLCHADSTLQLEIEVGQGVPAFHMPYQCRSWQQLVDHVDRMNEQRGPYEHQQPMNHETT